MGGTIRQSIEHVEKFLAVRGNPEQVNCAVIVSWSVNEAFSTQRTLLPGAPKGLKELIDILGNLLSKFRQAAFIVGGSSELWGIRDEIDADEFDALLHQCRMAFDRFGIIVDSGLSVWETAHLRGGWSLV